MTKFGMWANNQIVEGHWIYPNGTYFEGKFENNKPTGKGIWNFKDGKKLEGEFEQKPKDFDGDMTIDISAPENKGEVQMTIEHEDTAGLKV